jgi:hypothetical protein
MTKNQLHAAGGDDGDTCLHALAAAGANTRNLMKYVLDRGGYEMLEMRNGVGLTPLECARASLEALKTEDADADRRLAKILPPHVTEDPAEVDDIKRRLMAKFHRTRFGLMSCIEELELAAKIAAQPPAPRSPRSPKKQKKQTAVDEPEPAPAPVPEPAPQPEAVEEDVDEPMTEPDAVEE